MLKDANFGELFFGGYKPESIDHLFLSIQTFNSQNFTSKTAPDFYDYIVVDEFHHAAAPTYQKLLQHYRPKILLGLTATPERMDGYDKSELERVYAFSGVVAQRRAELAAASVMKYVTDIDEVKGLGFCVSVEHANFMGGAVQSARHSLHQPDRKILGRGKKLRRSTLGERGSAVYLCC